MSVVSASSQYEYADPYALSNYARGELSADIAGNYFIPAETLWDDLDMLRERILDTHQNPFTYCSEDEFESAYDLAYNRVGNGLFYYDYARVVSDFLRVLRDSHTYVDFGSQFEYYTHNDGRYCSFGVHETPQGLLIAYDRDSILSEGYRMLSFNGYSAEEINSTIYSYSVSEGNSPEGTLRMKDALFPGMFPMHFPVFEYNTVCLQPPGTADTLCLSYPGRTAEEWQQLRKEARKQAQKGKSKSRAEQDTTNAIDIDDTYALQFVDSLDLAIVKVGSFSHRSDRHFVRSMNRIFKAIKDRKTANIAIDLRDNFGGKASRALSLLGYAGVEKGKLPSNVVYKQSELARQRNNNALTRFQEKYLDIFYRKNEEWQHFKRMLNLPQGKADTLYYKGTATISRYSFYGPASVWVNGRSASASVIFTSIFRKESRGPVLGQPCLGPESGTWGNPTPFVLENSGLPLYFSTIRLNSDDSFSAAPDNIVPDIRIPFTLKNGREDLHPFLLGARQWLKGIW